MASVTNSSLSSLNRLACPVSSSLVSKIPVASSVVPRSCPHLHPVRNSQDSPHSLVKNNHQEVIKKNHLISSLYSVKEPKDFSEIPAARHLPFVGTTFDLMAAGGAPFLHSYFDKRHKSLGRLFREKLGSLDCVFVADAKLMQEVYSNEGQYPVHSVPEPWTIFNDMKGIQRGLFFM
jgi:hypothetical protein